MASTSPRRTIPFTVNTGVKVGQGISPQIWVLYSTDDASVSTPNWIDATPRVRSFSTSRGRESELGEIEAGTATIVVDNRLRTFDPLNNALIRPLNRWWIREQFASETQDIFKGYAESYDLQWPEPGYSDAVSVVQCVDELKVLALSMPPLTDPPRESYTNLVAFDNPDAYWGLGDDQIGFVQSEDIGPGTTSWEVEYPPPQKANDPALPNNKKRQDPRKGH